MMRCWREARRVLLLCIISGFVAFPDGSHAGTNALDWSFELPFDAYSSPALTSDGSMIIGCGQGSSAALGALLSVSKTGQLNWRLPIGPVMASPLIAPDDTIYVGSTIGTFYSVSAAGDVNWIFRSTNSAPPLGRGRVHSSAALGADGTIFVTAVGQGLFAIHPDGTLKWLFPISALASFALQISSPAVGADGTIYLGSADKKVYAIWPDGTKRWEYLTGNNISSSPAITEDGTVLIGSDDGKLYAFEPDGTLKWDFDTGRIIESSCVVGEDGTIYIGSLNDRIFALNPSGGVKWSNIVSGPISATPVLGDNGNIWVPALDGSLHVFHADGTSAGTTPPRGILFSSPVISLGPEPCLYFSQLRTLYSRPMTNGLASSPWPMFRRNPTHSARANQLRLDATLLASGELELTLLVSPGQLYFVECSENLSSWTTLQQVNSTGTEMHIQLPRTSTNTFYRLRRAATDLLSPVD